MNEINKNKKIEQELSSVEKYLNDSTKYIPRFSVTAEEVLRNIKREEMNSYPSPYKYINLIMSKKIIFSAVSALALIIGYFGFNYSHSQNPSIVSDNTPITADNTSTETVKDDSKAQGQETSETSSLAMIDSITTDLLNQSSSETDQAVAVINSYQSDTDTTDLDTLINLN